MIILASKGSVTLGSRYFPSVENLHVISWSFSSESLNIFARRCAPPRLSHPWSFRLLFCYHDNFFLHSTPSWLFEKWIKRQGGKCQALRGRDRQIGPSEWYTLSTDYQKGSDWCVWGSVYLTKCLSIAEGKCLWMLRSLGGASAADEGWWGDNRKPWKLIGQLDFIIWPFNFQQIVWILLFLLSSSASHHNEK